jgi:hypothetical protein
MTRSTTTTPTIFSASAMAQIGVPGAPTIPAHALSGAIAAAAFRTALGLALNPAHQEVACSRAFDPRVRPCRIL